MKPEVIETYSCNKRQSCPPARVHGIPKWLDGLALLTELSFTDSLSDLLTVIRLAPCLSDRNICFSFWIHNMPKRYLLTTDQPNSFLSVLLSWSSLKPALEPLIFFYYFRARVHCHYRLYITFSANHARRSEELRGVPVSYLHSLTCPYHFSSTCCVPQPFIVFLIK